MEFYDINKFLDKCDNFFFPVEHLYKTKIQIEADRIKAERNQINHLKGEIKC